MKLGMDCKQVGFIVWSQEMNRRAWILDAQSRGLLVVEHGTYATIHDPAKNISQ